MARVIIKTNYMTPIGVVSAGLTALGAGLGIVKIGGSGIKSISDNPEQAK